MYRKFTSRNFVNNGPIKTLYPGILLSNGDSGIGSIGRIDHAHIATNTVVPMHSHVNDEILSYFRTGTALHTDSQGFVEIIGENRIMLMKAGKEFYHEEKVIGNERFLEGLQIFIRPIEKDLNPEVVFLELEELHSVNDWRLLASPTPASTLQFSSQTWIYDMKLLSEKSATLPDLPKNNLTVLVYVFKGKVLVNNEMELNQMEGLIFRNEEIIFKAGIDDAQLVIFITDEQSAIFNDGMYSGNKI